MINDRGFDYHTLRGKVGCFDLPSSQYTAWDKAVQFLPRNSCLMNSTVSVFNQKYRALKTVLSRRLLLLKGG